MSKSSRRRARAKVRKQVAQRRAVPVTTVTTAVRRAPPARQTVPVLASEPATADATNAAAIARRELGALFLSPVGWIVAGLFVFLVSGFGFIGTVLAGQQATMTGAFDVVTGFLLVILIPLLTMRLSAKQRSHGDWKLVVGRWLGVFVFYVLLVATTFIYVLLFAIYLPKRDALDWGLVATTYVGLLVVGAAAIAVGVLASSVARNQVVAYVVSLVAVVAIWYASFGFGLVAAPALIPFFDYIAAYHRYQSFTLGLLSLRDAVYFVSIAVAALFVTSRVLAARRWR